MQKFIPKDHQPSLQETIMAEDQLQKFLPTGNLPDPIMELPDGQPTPLITEQILTQLPVKAEFPTGDHLKQ
jgi:hypothetical protein